MPQKMCQTFVEFKWPHSDVKTSSCLRRESITHRNCLPNLFCNTLAGRRHPTLVMRGLLPWKGSSVPVTKPPVTHRTFHHSDTDAALASNHRRLSCPWAPLLEQHKHSSFLPVLLLSNWLKLSAPEPLPLRVVPSISNLLSVQFL